MALELHYLSCVNAFRINIYTKLPKDLNAAGVINTHLASIAGILGLEFKYLGEIMKFVTQPYT